MSRYFTSYLGLIECRHLLTDTKTRRVLLILPSVLPHSLLTLTLLVVFHIIPCTNIMLMTSPLLSLVGAGVRNGVVIDIGWHETTITTVFEYREVHQTQSNRGMKSLARETARFLSRKLRKAGEWHEVDDTEEEDELPENDISFEECEDIMQRMVWCQGRTGDLRRMKVKRDLSTDLTGSLQSLVIVGDDGAEEKIRPQDDESIVKVPLYSSRPPTTVEIPFKSFSYPAESTFFPIIDSPDDNELPLPDLLYKHLLALPVDVRGHCMSRIMFTGGGSNIPGIRQRLMTEVLIRVAHQGWERASGQAFEKAKCNLRDRAQYTRSLSIPSAPVKVSENTEATQTVTSPLSSAALAEPELDPQLEKIKARKEGKAKTRPSGVLNVIETLGPWAGGSLLASLKVKGIVDIEKDRFMQHGLEGSSRLAPSTSSSKAPANPGHNQKANEKTSWNLGIWA